MAPPMNERPLPPLPPQDSVTCWCKKKGSKTEPTVLCSQCHRRVHSFCFSVEQKDDVTHFRCHVCQWSTNQKETKGRRTGNRRAAEGTLTIEKATAIDRIDITEEVTDASARAVTTATGPPYPPIKNVPHTPECDVIAPPTYTFSSLRNVCEELIVRSENMQQINEK